jgi:hyaluronan synthase
MVSPTKRGQTPSQTTSDNSDEHARLSMRACFRYVADILRNEDVTLTGEKAIRRLCITQPHVNKKCIMFSSLVFAISIAEIMGIEFIWSSDSDTIVFQDTLEKAITMIARNPRLGGGSTGLTIHNGTESTIARLAVIVYWSEFYLNRSISSFTATSDCQSGPSALFRVTSLPQILIPWYNQKVFGKRMVGISSSRGFKLGRLYLTDSQRRLTLDNEPSEPTLWRPLHPRCTC